MTRSHGRYPYSPITARPLYDWPGGKRLAVYIGLNLEWFAFGEGLGAELAPGGPQPDVLNYAWRDYGNRVGVFRLAELFGEINLPVSLLVNAAMVEHAPQALDAFPNAEIVGHGRSNSERQGTLSEDDERGLMPRPRKRWRNIRGFARAAGSGPGSRNRLSRPTSCKSRAIRICSTGATTTSRSG